MARAILSILSVMVAFPVSSFEFGATLTRHFPRNRQIHGDGSWHKIEQLAKLNQMSRPREELRGHKQSFVELAGVLVEMSGFALTHYRLSKNLMPCCGDRT